MADYILLCAALLFEFGLFYFLPVFNGRGTLFGLVLKEEDYLTEGLPIVRKYRRDLSVVFLGAVGGLVVLLNFSLKSLAIVYIFATAMTLVILFKYLRRSWRLRDRSVVGRLATSLKPRRLKDFTHPWLEAVVVLLTVTPFAVLAYYYPLLPDTVPVHWNAAGEPDGWERKTFYSLFFAPLLGAWLQIFWVVLKQDIVKARLRVPAGGDAERVLALKENAHRANVGLLDWCRVVGAVLLSGVSLMVLTVAPVALPVGAALNTLVWASVAVMLGGVAYFFYRIILVNREIREITGHFTFQTAAETEGWDAGGLFYYNPNDAAFMIEKPGGVGYTFNFAHRRAFVYLTFILFPMVLAVLSVASMTN